MNELSKTRVQVDPHFRVHPAQWLVVVVRRPTGVFYEHQCGGTLCDQNEVEGYLVLLGDYRFTNGERLSPEEFTAVFHIGDGCAYSRDRMPYPDALWAKLRALLSEVGFVGDNGYDCLKLDESRLTEVSEAWVPVITSSGPGVLIWENCD